MSVAAPQSAAFFSEIAEHGVVWTISDSAGIPTSTTDKVTAMPFWSLKSRARKVADTVLAYRGFEPRGIPLQEFRERWLPGMTRDGLSVGINWSGERATGYDMTPAEVEARLAG